MEKRFVRVPFDIDIAKKITNGQKEGRVVTRNGRNARIICFDAKSDHPIVALVNYYKDGESPENYTQRGLWGEPDEEFDGDLMLEIPETSANTSFKEGDVVVFGNGNIAIFKSKNNDEIDFHVILWGENVRRFNSVFINVKLRYATEDEKNRLIDALKRDHTEKSCYLLKEFFGIETQIFTEYEDYSFITGMAVLGVDETGKWKYDLFSHTCSSTKGVSSYVCSGSTYKKIIPFYGNERLAGTEAKAISEESKQCKKRKENNV